MNKNHPFYPLISSDLWEEDPPTRIVMLTLIMLSDASGRVEVAKGALARFAGVTPEDCGKAVQRLMKIGRPPALSGIDGIWTIAGRFLPCDRRRTQNREAQARYRARRKGAV